MNSFHLLEDFALRQSSRAAGCNFSRNITHNTKKQIYICYISELNHFVWLTVAFCQMRV